ncbi:MAG: nuclear transport factor 2 family protein [Bacteroidota bacterium]
MNKASIAHQWIDAWNRHDLQAVMKLYSEDIQHVSPKIARYLEVEGNRLQGKDALHSYFEQALSNNPALEFDLHHILEGQQSMVLIYRRNGTQLSGEYLELNQQGLIMSSRSHYL